MCLLGHRAFFCAKTMKFVYFHLESNDEAAPHSFVPKKF